MATVYVSKSIGAASGAVGADSGADGSRTHPYINIHGGMYTINRSGSAGDSGPHELIIMDSQTYQEATLGVYPTLARNNLTFMAETGSNGLPIVNPILQGSGSAATPQTFAIYCDAGWVIKGITFKNWVCAAGEGIIKQRSTSAGEGGITVELCTFYEITGTCINAVGAGGAGNNPGYHTIRNNTFYDFQASSSSGATIHGGGSGSPIYERQMKILNNVFYDWKPHHVSNDLIIYAGANNPMRPLNIISHNTFGTSSIGANVFPANAIYAPYAKFEYNIIAHQTNTTSFADIEDGEANYNITHDSFGGGTHAPFGGSDGPTGSANNIVADPIFKGPQLFGAAANYRLGSTGSPAVDAAIGSSDVSLDRTGLNRTTLDLSALATGIFDIGAYELTGLWSDESPDSLPQIGADFVINRIPNADNQNRRGLQEGNSAVLGHDVDQVPLTTAINGAIPSFIRKKPSASNQETGKKG